MKTLILFSTLAALFVWGCSDSMDVMNDNFDFTIDKTLTVDHSANGAQTSDKLDLWESGSAFMRNRGSVRSLDLRSISCMITDMQGTTPATLSGTLSIGDPKSGVVKPIASINNADMMDMMSGMHGMDMRSDGRDMMMDIMMGQDSMMMTFECNDPDSMHFTMRFKFDMKAMCENMDMMK